ncbi:hypothetical protein D3C85_1866480 [compost metagenome]
MQFFHQQLALQEVGDHVGKQLQYGLCLRGDLMRLGAGRAQRAKQHALIRAHRGADIGLDAQLAGSLRIGPAV